jgi:hypothetical protein
MVVFLPRRSQITLIVIVGILLLIVFFFLFSLRKLPASKETVSTNKLIYEIESGLAKDHITGCMYKIASDGLEKMGSDGGYIYVNDGGTIPLDLTHEGTDYLSYIKGQRAYYVAYGLRENRFCPLVKYTLPDYPYANEYMKNLSGIYVNDAGCTYSHSAADYDGFFGQNSMPKLCPFIDGSGCKVFAKGDMPGLTMERQLEDYMASKLPLCVNLSSFADQYDADIAQNGKIAVKASIRDNDVEFAVNYPFKISFAGQTPINKVVDYQTVLKVRLGAIYDFIYAVISRDSRDLYYNSSLSNQISANYKPGFSFKKIENACKTCPYRYKFDDIFEVIDTQSILNGLPFIFRTAVQERVPVFDLLKAQYDYNLSDYNTPNYNVVDIPLNALDPDDDGLKYVFMSDGFDGWRENESLIVPDTGSGTKLFIVLTPETDYGMHQVGILVYDKAGLFDFQKFIINATEDTSNSYSQDVCLNPCISNNGAGFDCDQWCTIAANSCASLCGGSDFDFNPSQGCSICVSRIMGSGDLELVPDYHPNCPVLTRQECIGWVPDCFWVIQDIGGGFQGNCINDWDLPAVIHPAFIVDS